MAQTLVEAVLTHAGTDGDKPALITRGSVTTYAELARRVKRMAAILRTENGVEAGDRVMITGLSKQDYPTALLAVQYLRAVTVPVDKVWLEETVLRLYDTIEPKLVLTDMPFHREGVRARSLKELFDTAAEPGEAPADTYVLPEADAIAEMLFTTGTTGTPKGVMLSFGNILAITENNIAGTDFRKEDVLLDALPLCHSLGLRLLRMSLYTGATAVIQNGFAFPKELRENVLDNGCTAFVCVPAIMEKLTREVKDFPELFGHFRLMEIGAGSLSLDLKKRLPELLPNVQIYNTWGSSETGGVIFLDVNGRPDKAAALGKPVETAEVKVIGPDGGTVKARDMDTAGRLALRGKMTMAGYYNLPEITAETLVDGWLYTNDLVYMDDEGFVYMLGRADDIINVGGEKVSPLEIENTASEFEKVWDTACIGVADPVLGQVPVLFVQTAPSFRAEELASFLAQQMEPFKQPREIIQVPEIPRNRMKKLDRKGVRALWDEHCRQKDEDDPMIRLILTRHSVRVFEDRPVPREILETLIDAGIHAPSGKNRQSWRFTVVTSPFAIEKIRETGAAVAAREKTGFSGFNHPPALILITNDEENDNGAPDSACAAENILLAAHALGLGACWLNGLTRISRQPEIRSLLSGFGVPENHRVWCMIALGYPAETPKAPSRRNDVVQWIE